MYRQRGALVYHRSPVESSALTLAAGLGGVFAVRNCSGFAVGTLEESLSLFAPGVFVVLHFALHSQARCYIAETTSKV